MDVKTKEVGGRGAKRAVGERSVVPAERAGVPDPELVVRATRRQFPAEYKLRMLAEAAAATGPGEIGALLRREGLYSSHLTYWRQQREQQGLAAFRGKRGPKADPVAAENAALRRRAERAEAELVKARKVIDIQGNVSALLGLMLDPSSAPAAETFETPAPRGRRSKP